MAYPKCRPTPKLRKATDPLTAYLRCQLLARRPLYELYAPGSLGDCQQFIHVRLTFWGRRWVANRLTKLYQERLQRPCRCIHKQELALLCSCVSEGVHRRPGNVDHRAGTSIDLALAKDELELAFEDVVGFILAAVQVRRWPALGRDFVLEDPHRLALVPINLEVKSSSANHTNFPSPWGTWNAVRVTFCFCGSMPSAPFLLPLPKRTLAGHNALHR